MQIRLTRGAVVQQGYSQPRKQTIPKEGLEISLDLERVSLGPAGNVTKPLGGAGDPCGDRTSSSTVLRT